LKLPDIMPHLHLHQSAELLDAILAGRLPADAQMDLYFRAHRNMGVRDRAMVAETVYGVLRQRRLLAHLAGGESATAPSLAPARADVQDARMPRRPGMAGSGLGPIAVKLLTSCPACQQGLARYQPETGLQTDYIVVELANRLLGEHWQHRFIERAKHGGIEQVLL
jgi:hypothetical protein